ncbi:hypothetical protein HDU78_000883 [Chytriomyces hyalinus]|nr:hypothetical protein HDU78_000883 [Chytriomyces hyalinus]
MDQLLAACATATSPDAIPSSAIPGHPSPATRPASLSHSPTDSGVGRSKDLLPALSASPSLQPAAAVHEQTKPHQQQQQQQQHGSTSPVSSVDPRRQRRYRIPKDEMEGLKEFFERNSRPSSEQIYTLSAKLGMEERKVRIWFQNMRSRKGNKSNSPSNASTSNTQPPALHSLPEQKTYPVQSGKPSTPAYHPAFQTETNYKPATDRISSKHTLPPPQLHSLAPTPSVVEARQFTLPPLSVTSAIIDESCQKNRFPLPPVPFYHPSNSSNHQTNSGHANAGGFDGRYPQMDSRDQLPFPSVAYPHAIPSSISSLSVRQPPMQVSNAPHPYPAFHTHPSQQQQQGSDITHLMVPPNAPSQQLGQSYYHAQQQQQQQQLAGNSYAYRPLAQQHQHQLHLNQIPGTGPMHPVDPYRPVALPNPTPSGTVSPVTPATNSPASFTATLESGKQQHAYAAHPPPPSKISRRSDSHDNEEDDDAEDGTESHRSSSTHAANRKGEKRFIMSREHLRWLKQIFEETPFPSSDQMQYIADTVGMDKRQVRVWFQNRRAVLKRKMHPCQ